MGRNLQDLHEDPTGRYIKRKLKSRPLVSGNLLKYHEEKLIEKYRPPEEE